SRMFGPSQELTDKFSDQLRTLPDIDTDRREILSDYVRRSFGPCRESNRPHRVMLLLFEGENAIKKIYNAAGGLHDTQESADTVRGTYGDCVRDSEGKLLYIEPAVLIAPSVLAAREILSLWMQYAETDGGIIDNALSLKCSHPQKTLVIIKPDNFRYPSSRPGNIIDLFAHSGLRIIGAQVHRMSMAEAKEFYGPIQAILREKLSGKAVERAVTALQSTFNFPIPATVQEALSQTLGPHFGDRQFYEILQFMTGLWLPDVPDSELNQEGNARCLVLIYAGENAVDKIRCILGPTDPSKAQPGSVRKEYGSDIMVNAAHASDSAENAKREMNIIKLERNHLKKWFNQYYN
ncbi:MAG: nucleoside-diphosphate kinase, partial [Kiritimatiellaceae bacterium]|nr:nucleoside-diphosphate kinase [Kiritimatiellaceae bacterium]